MRDTKAFAAGCTKERDTNIRVDGKGKFEIMNTYYECAYSRCLEQDMEYKLYGDRGMLCLVIPCQDGRFFEWEDRRMFDVLGEYIEQGKAQFLCVDSIDQETWSSFGDSSYRMARLESWCSYVVEELIPSVLEKTGRTPDTPVMVMGASMGATHAANLFFRFPDRFKRILAMSGIYDLSAYIYDNNFDGNFYQNSPLAYLPNMDVHHAYIDKYNHSQAVFTVGQGSWEGQTIYDLHRMEEVFGHKGIHIPCYFWGYDTPHDWPSWEKQVQVYLPQLLG